VTLRDGLQTRTCRTAPARVPLRTTRPAYGQGDARSAATSADGLLRGTAGRRIGFGPTARLGTIWGPHVLHAGRRPARRLGVHTVLIPPLTRIDAYSNVLGVKGSQVQILSSRTQTLSSRPTLGPLTLDEHHVSGPSCCYGLIFSVGDCAELGTLWVHLPGMAGVRRLGTCRGGKPEQRC
jgi:hypothetical protein